MDHAITVPAVAQYVDAFRAVEARITPKQRELLRLHHAAPARVISATKLAELVGFDGYTAVNLQYGLLASAVATELGISVDPNVMCGVLVDFVDPGHAENAHWLWVLRPNVAAALEDLGWVPRLSHLMYPQALSTPES
jgi:5-methylcytosine-specific restriction enzyme A